MEHVLKETEQQVDTQQKYGKRLDALAELMEIDERKRTIINAEINELTATRDEKLESITVAFKQMQDREKEISTGLINTKTGKELPQKVTIFLKNPKIYLLSNLFHLTDTHSML